METTYKHKTNCDMNEKTVSMNDETPTGTM